MLGYHIDYEDYTRRILQYNVRNAQYFTVDKKGSHGILKKEGKPELAEQRSNKISRFQLWIIQFFQLQETELILYF